MTEQEIIYSQIKEKKNHVCFVTIRQLDNMTGKGSVLTLF